MPKEFRLPDLGENVESATVIKMMVSEGDYVEEDQNVMEVETEKATTEVPSSVSGTIQDLQVQEDDEISVGQTIFTVDEAEAGEEPEEKKKEEKLPQAEQEKAEEKPKKEQAEEKEPVEEKAEVEERERKRAEAEEEPPPREKKDKAQAQVEKKEEETPAVSPEEAAPAAPSVRRLAREIGVDINRVEGSGPGGRITEDDVKAASRKTRKAAPAKAAAPGARPLPDFSQWGPVRSEELTNVRRVIGERMSQSWNTVPHVHQYDKADITELEKLRKEINERAEEDNPKITITPILLKLTASVLKRYPQLRSSLDNDNNRVIYKDYYHIGMAADTERGLMVPVIRDVDQKTIRELAGEVRAVAEKARDGKLTVDDMRGGVFSISNLGSVGGTFFNPVINYPEVAVLGVPRFQKECVMMNGKPEERLTLQLCLGYDHRAVDGVLGAKFLHEIVTALSNPSELFAEL